tara:strand:- start:631 stop:873 length:243 start_codon:yes stop_codon:yes gene_type:complete
VKKKKNKAAAAIGKFSGSIRAYIFMEYKDAYYDIYNSVKITREVRRLTTEYYFGGNTVPFTAGQIVDYARSKYDFNKKDQ